MLIRSGTVGIWCFTSSEFKENPSLRFWGLALRRTRLADAGTVLLKASDFVTLISKGDKLFQDGGQ